MFRSAASRSLIPGAIAAGVMSLGTLTAAAPGPGFSGAGTVSVKGGQPIAVTGGIVAIEVENSEPPSHWPATVPIQLDGGATVPAALAWVANSVRAAPAGWTAVAQDLIVLSPAEVAALGADVDPATGVLVLLSPVPKGYSGLLRVGDQEVHPQWLPASATAPPLPASSPDPPAAPPASAAPAAAAPSAISNTLLRDDRPDPDSVSEYWRAVLIADSGGAAPPPPPGGERAALYARHRAELWRAGLERVRRASPGVAAELTELLTAVVQDPSRPSGSGDIAAWVARPGELSGLLAILLDMNRNEEGVMKAALAWSQARGPLTFWVESDAGDQVRVAVANPTPAEVAVRFNWLEEKDSVPVALLVPARAVGRLGVDRPKMQELPPGAPGMSARQELAAGQGATLMLEALQWRGRLLIGPPQFPAKPPGLGFATFLPALTLATAQSQRAELPRAPFRTTASLRKLDRTWEIFLECLRPQRIDGDVIEVTLGTQAAEQVSFRVAESGAVEVVHGAAAGAPAAHCASYADRWRCRLELPDTWLPPAQLGKAERPLTVRLARIPGAAALRQTAALPVPAWQPPPPVQADLSAWTDLPAPSASDLPGP